MNKTKGLVKKLYLGFSLLILFDAILPQIITLGGRILLDQYRMIMNVFALVTFGVATVLIILNYKTFKRRIIDTPYLLFATIIWIYSSYLWTSNLYATFESTVLLTLTIFFIVYAYSIYTIEAIWNSLYKVSLLIVFTSVLFVLIVPSVGKMPEGVHQGDWRGVFLHKNGLGNYVAIINVIFLSSIRNNYKFHISIVGYLLSLILVFGSGSKTALASVIFIHIVLLLLALVRNKVFSFKLTLSFISLPVLFIVLYIFKSYDQIALILGGDTNLTGRIPLWFHVFQAISEKPLLGYGYGAFWGYEYGSLKFMDAMIWESGKSHNALLDIWLDLGLFGTILFSIFLLSTFSRLIKIYRESKSVLSESYLLITIMIVSVSMIDFRILYYNSIILFLVVYIYMYSFRSISTPSSLRLIEE